MVLEKVELNASLSTKKATQQITEETNQPVREMSSLYGYTLIIDR